MCPLFFVSDSIAYAAFMYMVNSFHFSSPKSLGGKYQKSKTALWAYPINKCRLVVRLKQVNETWDLADWSKISILFNMVQVWTSKKIHRKSVRVCELGQTYKTFLLASYKGTLWTVMLYEIA